MSKPEVSIFWFRRDLRLNDNHGLFQALSAGIPVLPLFIFDPNILDRLEKPYQIRVQFIHQSLQEIDEKLKQHGAGLKIIFDTPVNAFRKLLKDYNVKKVFTNRDYEKYAIERDRSVREMLQSNGVAFNDFKDQVIFEKLEVSKDDGTPYTVFTPYSRKWKYNLSVNPIQHFPSEKLVSNFLKISSDSFISLSDIGFASKQIEFPSALFPIDIIKKYTQQRDYPSINGTSKLGVHLRFGTISIRELAAKASGLNETFLNELIWRDFYQSILSNFPHVSDGYSFKRDYDNIQWRNNEAEFEKWCKGQTGYPIVDAGMRELEQTGFMHNRVRMIVASFLTKHLLIDWRWGEAWFAAKLLDHDFAANNGGWQWAAGSGCDAAPYFRVFNPYLQTEKFDKEGKYIRKWVPEFDSLEYARPMVEHDFARKRCLDNYAKYLSKD
jgi:deoxyribodipyrimidine photo-lyase